jgi:hypothetical protein
MSNQDAAEARKTQGYCQAVVDAVKDWGLEPVDARSMLQAHSVDLSQLEHVELTDFERGFITALLSGEN